MVDNISLTISGTSILVNVSSPESSMNIDTGVQGPPGRAGYSGFSGYSGRDGLIGVDGQSGFSGVSGYSGAAFVGSSGYSGVSGYSGIGISGFSGYSGVSGISGYSGLDGQSGYSGISGVSGFSGASGTSGFSGYSGSSGTSGYSGLDGSVGVDGQSGYSGFSGESGVSGISGYSGVSGTSGYSGLDGSIGVDGQSGFSGYSGTSGISGVSGYSGEIGISGYSGYSGSTGLIGGGISGQILSKASDTDGDIQWSSLKTINDETLLGTTNITISGSKTLAVFTPLDNQPPATAFATLDTRNSIAVLDFDDGLTNESAVFVGVIPEGADLSSGIVARIFWMATSATSGNVRWGVQFEKYSTDNDSDSFDTATEVHTATSGTSGVAVVTEITATAIDSLAAGDQYRVKVYRDSSDTGNDTASGDAELIAIELRQVA